MVGKKPGSNWFIPLFFVLGLTLIFLFWGFTSGNAPATDVSTISFNCSLWSEATFTDGLSSSVSVQGVNYPLSNFETVGKEFHKYGNDCGGDGCPYQGLFNDISYSGTNSGIGSQYVILVDSSSLVYRCRGQEGA